MKGKLWNECTQNSVDYIAISYTERKSNKNQICTYLLTITSFRQNTKKR